MKLLIVDDHVLVRQALTVLLIRDTPGAEVLQAGDSAGGLQLAATHGDLDLVFLDLQLPGTNGMAMLRELGRLRPALPVIVLSAADDPALVRQAFEAGALGYVPKSASSETLLMALRLVLSGETFVPALLLRERAAPRPSRLRSPDTDAFGRLTLRQAEVLRRLGEGLSTRGIAETMSLSEKTVKVHITGVFRALGATGRREAIAMARAAGFN